MDVLAASPQQRPHGWTPEGLHVDSVRAMLLMLCDPLVSGLVELCLQSAVLVCAVRSQVVLLCWACWCYEQFAGSVYRS